MKGTQRHLVLLALAVLLPTLAMAHAGMFDRYLDYRVSALALFHTCLFVQVVLSAFSFGILRKTRPFRRLRVSCWHWSKKWYYSLFFLFLIPFVMLTTVDMDYVIMWLIAGGSLLAIVICYAVCSFRLLVSKKRKPSWRRLYSILIVSVQQIVGYGVYLLSYHTDLMRSIFNYTDDEYQIANYWVYPDTQIFKTHIEGYVSMFIVLLCWYAFLLMIIGLKLWWTRRKERKNVEKKILDTYEHL